MVFTTYRSEEGLALAPVGRDLVDDLAAGRLESEIPAHGTVARVRQRVTPDRAVGAVPPEDVTEAPVWMDGKAAL